MENGENKILSENIGRYFNITGACDPQRHYMVDIQGRLKEIKELVDKGAYFTINRARQYGKTTTIKALRKYLTADYVVISLDFQKLGNEEFENASIFSKAFVRYLLRTVRNRKKPVHGLPEDVLAELEMESRMDPIFSLGRLFEYFSDMCDTSEKPVVLIIDEVDSAANNQNFLATDDAQNSEIFIYASDNKPQFIIELKVWRGSAYNERGEKQLSDYLDYFRLQKGYMLSYNFNQKKEIGVKKIRLGDRVLVEAVV